MFSASFDSSAIFGSLTTVTNDGSSRKLHSSARVASLHPGVTPPHTFGVLARVQVVLPGSTRSGE